MLDTPKPQDYKKNPVPQPSQYKRVVHTRAGACWLKHRWVDIGMTGYVVYKECKDCHARMAEGTGYISRQSLDWVMNA